MLYYCRSCSTSLVVGAAYCASCGSMFPKPVPVDAGRREAYQPHQRAPWPGRPDSLLDKVGGAAINRARKIPPALQFGVCFIGLSAVVWFSWKDFHRPRHVTAPILSISVDGAPDDSGDGGGSPTGESLLRQLAKSAARLAPLGADADEPLPASAAAATSAAIIQVAQRAQGDTLAASVAPDSTARNAAARLTPQQKAQVADEIAALTGKRAPKANSSFPGAFQTRSGDHSGSRLVAQAQLPRSRDGIPDHAVVDPAQVDTSKWGVHGSSPATSASDPASSAGATTASLPQTEQQALRQATSKPSTPSAPPGVSPTGSSTEPVHGTRSRALIRLRHIYLGARIYFLRYSAAAGNPRALSSHARDVTELRYMLVQAALVYSWLQPQEREEWQQDITTIAVWHVAAKGLRDSIKTT